LYSSTVKKINSWIPSTLLLTGNFEAINACKYIDATSKMMVVEHKALGKGVYIWSQKKIRLCHRKGLKWFFAWIAQPKQREIYKCFKEGWKVEK
jgi:hypothetical protein